MAKLITIVLEEPFMKWGLYFIVQLNQQED